MHGAQATERTPERQRRGERAQPLLGQVGPTGHPLEVGHLVAGRDRVAVEDAQRERREPAVEDGDHRLVHQRQPVGRMAGLDQRPTLGVDAHGDHVGLVQPAPEVLQLARCHHRVRRPARLEVPLHRGQEQQVAVHGALRQPLRQASRAAEPAHALRLVAARQVVDPEPDRSHRGRVWSGLGQEGVVRGRAEPQAVLERPIQN